jgi:hypothetical protein
MESALFWDVNHVVRQKFIKVSEYPTASISRVDDMVSNENKKQATN